MKIPVHITAEIPNTDANEICSEAHAVMVCQNDGDLIFKHWNGRWYEALTKKPHTCRLEGFSKETL